MADKHIHTNETCAMPPDWATVDGKSLPAGAFADEKNREYPHHHVVGATMQDANGCCTDGKMYLHLTGAKEAIVQASADGAKKAVVNHLAEHAFSLAGRDPRGEAPIASPMQGADKTNADAGKAREGVKVCEGKDVPPLQVIENGAGGYLEGYAAVFDNVDEDGEVIRKGAFTKTIRDLVAAGKHKLMTLHLCKGGSVKDIVGTVTQAHEDDFGFWIHAEFATDADSQAARIKAKEGHVGKLSIGYKVIRDKMIEIAGKVVRELLELKVPETTLTPWPANDLAAVTSVKTSSVHVPENQPDTAPVRPPTVDWKSVARRRRIALTRSTQEICEHG